MEDSSRKQSNLKFYEEEKYIGQASDQYGPIN